MAYAIKFDGVTQRAGASPWTPNDPGEWSVAVDFITGNNITSDQFVCGYEQGTTRSWKLFINAGNVGVLHASSWNVGGWFITPILANTRYTATAKFTSGVWSFELDGSLIGSAARATSNRPHFLSIAANNGGTSNADVSIVTIECSDFTNPSNGRLYDATASDHSNGGGSAPYPQPILVDTVGGNNATGVGFSTTDLGYWVNLGGGTPDSIVDFSISKPEFSISSSASLPAPSSIVDFNISKPEFSINSSATLPAPQSSINLEISKPIFSIDSSATLPTPQSQINIGIASPEFNIQSSATIPYPQSAISIDVAAPLFSIQSSVIGSVKSSITLSIAKPQFNIESAATLPNPASAVELTISRPAFKIYSYIGGLDIIAADDARLTFSAGSNNLEFSGGSNSLTFNAQTNILIFKE